ncbi:P1 family peptidase [Ensifer adhaerens]|uniref:P1 family peptidase n=1 Tax=Ensifer TaxID=106591 RepID=UPI0008073336
MMCTGPLNLITDVAGLTVGNAEDHRLKSGVTAIVCDPPATAAVQVLGGAPGTRETDLLDPHNTVQTVDALVLSGGSAFGLDAASGAQAALREMGRGFAVGPHRIPIVPTAILFDLINGGDKDWGRYPPYRELGFEAVRRAGPSFATGTAGAGTGALTATFKGGLGSASTVLPSGITIGALVAVNALGSATVGDTGHFWSAPFELDGEFGALGLPHPLPADAADIRIKFRDRQSAAANTTIAVIATDAVLTKAEAKRLAIAAHDGFSRALWPAHTPLDGDLIFALATGASGKTPTLEDFIDLGAVAASTMARAIARGVHDAAPAENDLMPCWSQLS